MTYLRTSVSPTVILFAYDAKLLNIINSHVDHNELQADLVAMSDWCTKWNLLLNSNKCTSIHFHSSQSQDVADWPLNIDTKCA